MIAAGGGGNATSPPVVELRSYADGGGGAGAGRNAPASRAPVRATLRLDAAVALRDVRLPSPAPSSAPSIPSRSSPSLSSAPSPGIFVDVTLSSRDLRAVLPLCEALGADAALGAAGPGAPVLVRAVPRAGAAAAGPEAARMLACVEVQLVLATLAESAIEAPPAAAATPRMRHQRQHASAAAAPRASTSAASAPDPVPRRPAPATNFDDDDEDAFLGSMAAVDAAEAAAAAAAAKGGSGGRRDAGGVSEEETEEEEEEEEEGNGDGIAGTPPDERPGW